MRNLSILCLLVLLSSSHCLSTVTLGQHDESTSNPTDFIKRSCKTTLFPTLCFQCLSPYAGSIQPPGLEKQLAQAALQISLSRARSATDFVSRLSTLRGSFSREYQVVKDCFSTLGDSVYELSHSLKELGDLSQGPVVTNPNPRLSWHMSNVKTWVSAALTDDTTCLDGFSGSSSSSIDGNLKASIKSKVTDVAQVTSISLALVNRFANGHRPVVPVP